MRRLRAKPVQELSACTEAVVDKAIRGLLDLLQQGQILNKEGELSEPERLICTDEKGFSERADSIVKGVIARRQATRAVAAQTATSWDHLTVTSFLPASGRVYPAGLIASTTCVHDNFKELFSTGPVYSNPGGCTTAAIFADMVQACLAKPARQFIPESSSIILLLDSGGGSFLHLSPSFLLVCLRWNIKPYYLLAYTTKALMPLDMHCHSTMARIWSELKKCWSSKGHVLNIFTAIKAVDEVCKAALAATVARLVGPMWALLRTRSSIGTKSMWNERLKSSKRFGMLAAPAASGRVWMPASARIAGKRTQILTSSMTTT